MNKLRAFLLRPFVRAALTGRPAPSTVDMADVLDGGDLLVAHPQRLASARRPPASSAPSSSPAPGRPPPPAPRTPQHRRRDAALVIDECHNFLNLPYPIEDMLAEARGFRLSMTLAHQHLAQLPRELREGMSTNARNKIFFNVGPDDARELARHTQPHAGRPRPGPPRRLPRRRPPGPRRRGDPRLHPAHPPAARPAADAERRPADTPRGGPGGDAAPDLGQQRTAATPDSVRVSRAARAPRHPGHATECQMIVRRCPCPVPFRVRNASTASRSPRAGAARPSRPRITPASRAGSPPATGG